MKAILCFLAVFLSINCFSNPEYRLYPEGQLSLIKTIRQGQLPWDAHFRLSDCTFTNAELYRFSKDKYVPYGTISKLDTSTRGYLFKVGDEVQSTLHSFLLSSGTLFDSIKKYEVHDSSDHIIGYIEGVFYTDAPAEFLFYNEAGQQFAKAVLDPSYSKVTMSAPDDQPLLIGTKTFNYTGAPKGEHCLLEYYWELTQVSETPLDPRFLIPFMSFIGEVWWDKPQWFNF